MSAFLLALPAYRQLASMQLQLLLTYRTWLLIDLLGVLAQIYLVRMVWTAVYAGRDSVNGVGLEELITYLTLALLHTSWLMASYLGGYIHQRVREGTVAIDLARPAPYLGQLFAIQAGHTAGSLAVVLLSLPLAALVGRLQPPASPGAALAYGVSLFLAWLVNQLLCLLIGLIAFWTTEFRAFLGIYAYVTQFFAGALVPLAFFPDWLRVLAEWLPFRTQAALPLAIYLGQATGPALLRALAIQLAWVVVLAVAARLVWRRAYRRVVVQGG